MNKLKTGEFYGTHYQTLAFENIVITDTEYTHCIYLRWSTIAGQQFIQR